MLDGNNLACGSLNTLVDNAKTSPYNRLLAGAGECHAGLVLTTKLLQDLVVLSNTLVGHCIRIACKW